MTLILKLPRCGTRLTLLVWTFSFLCVAVPAGAQNIANGARVNPFARPLVVSALPERSAPSVASAEPALLQLRGLLQAGADSFANVDGHIVGIGETVGGMRLHSVTESSAVFIRNGKKVTMELSSASGQARVAPAPRESNLDLPRLARSTDTGSE